MLNVFRPQKYPQQEMEEALDKAIALSAGKRHYTVTGGQLLYEQHRRYRYAFTLVEGSWDLSDGTDLQLSSVDLINPLPVELSGTKDDTVTITATRRLTESTLTSAQLVVDRAFLLRKLKEAFLRESTTAQLGPKLFGVLDCPDDEADSYLVETIQDAFVTDESQRWALLRALASPLLVVLGPPGTGKTNVLAATALLHAMLFGYRVLLVSHTNVSLDNAVICLAQFFRACGLEQWLDEQRLVRFGNPHLAKLEEEEYRTVTMLLIVTDRVAPNRKKMASVEQRRATLLKQLAEHREELPEQVQAWQQRAAALLRKRKQAERTLANLEAEEHVRLAPIMEQLTPRLDQRAKDEQAMKNARADWEAADRQLYPLQMSYQEQWTRYETTNEKLEHVRKYPLVIRLVIQAWTGEWEKNLEAGIQTLAAQLHGLAEQIRVLQQAQAQAIDTYQQVRRRGDILAPAITYWEHEREARPAHAVEQQSTLTRQLSDLTQELTAGNPRIATIEREIVSWEQEVASLEETLARLDQQIADQWPKGEMPPRSRLYSLAPEGMETLEVESLTSYVARLARLYRVGPRFFLAEEIMPHLRYILHYYANFEKFGSFCRRNAMTMNGTGKVAKDWIDQLEQATMRTGLRDLTLQIWASGFPPSRLLRSAPAWCPSCYQEWQEQSCPIYQPLYWMLQTVTICFRHKRRLVEQCPHCQQMQSVIANKTLHEYCTQCTLWLGAHADQGLAEDIDEETLHWQHWVLTCIEELRQTGTSTDALPWARLASGIAVCVEATGGPKRCAELVAIKKEYLSLWLKGKVSPTLNKLLEFCYVLGISPLQLMTIDAMTLRDSIHAKSVFQTPRPRHPSHRKIDGDRALALIAEVLEGHEAPLPVFELERRLGLTPRTLKNRFPRECALVTAQYRAYRNEQVQQRTEQRGNEVRKVMLSLHAQGIYPSTYQVAPRLSNPNIIRKPVGRSTWKAVIHELGLERTRKKK